MTPITQEQLDKLKNDKGEFDAVALGKLATQDKFDPKLTPEYKDGQASYLDQIGGLNKKLEALNNQLNEQITRVLEVNGKHPLIMALAGIAGADGAGRKFSDAAWLLLDQARILEGEPLPDPAAFVRRIADLMAKGIAV